MIVKLNDVIARITGNVDRNNTDLLYYVGGEHYDSAELVIPRMGLLNSDEGRKLGFKFHFPFQKGDVLFMARNPHLRKAAMATENGICSDASYILRTKDENVLRQSYIPILVQQDAFWDYFEANKTGSVNFLMNWKDLKEYKFELPSIEEQDIICKKVWAAYRLKQEYKKLLASTDELVKSQFIEMFGNPVTNSKGWKTKKIKEVAPESPSSITLEGKVWLLNLDMIESNTGKIIEKVYENKENALSVQPFDEGNVLFSKLRPYLNKVVVPDEPGLATTELVPLRPKEDALNKVFLSHLLRGDQFVDFANEISGGTKMPRMPLKELREFDCILPPMTKQLELVMIAAQADKSKFDGFKSQFIEMFGSIDNNIHGYPVNRISDVCEILNGYAFQSKKYVDCGTRVIRIANVQKGYIEDTDPQFYPLSLLNEYEKYILFENDLLLSLTGNVGRVGLLPKEMIPAALNQRVACIRTNDRINKTFLFKMMNLDSFEKDCIDNSSGSAQKNMSTEWLKGYKFILPPMDMQEKFVRISEQTDKSKFDGFKSQFIEMFGDPVDLQGNQSNRTDSSCCSITSGFPFASEMFSEIRGSGLPLIRIRDVARGYSETYTKESCDAKYIVHAQDLLVGMDGMFDICPWQSEDALLNQRVCMIRPNDISVSNGLLIHAIRPVLKSIENITNGTTVKHLSAAQVGKIRLPNCSPRESDMFNAIVEQADKSKSINFS